jgi:CDP-Glycerol:Poly(glycerophosphate) glycerophosphotransferase
MERVRVLAMDHFSDQDLRSLEADPRLDIRRFPYQRLRQPAIRIMGRPVARGLHAYNDPQIADARMRYASWLRCEVEHLYLERSFDVILLPSDTFFYVRTLPAAAHELGIPVFVMQKETTISVHTMEEHSREMRVEAPFVADWMTVCSDRHREFWMRAGADGSLVEVTGQPRFDIYASRRSQGPSARRRRVLFLTNELDAYVPGVGQGMGLRTWEPLRDETESALIDLVRAGACEVLVKIHPQQNHRVESARIARRSGDRWHRGVEVAPPDADTRELIVGADVVVGFQSTALYEAVAAGRPVIYAAWGAEYERFRNGLIPFDQASPACIHHATSTAELTKMLSDELSPPGVECTAWYEEALGPVDGRATDRVTRRLMSIVAASTPTPRRRELEQRRARFAVGLLARALAAQTVWTAAIPVANIAGESRRVGIRRRRASEQRRLAIATLRRRAH